MVRFYLPPPRTPPPSSNGESLLNSLRKNCGLEGYTDSPALTLPAWQKKRCTPGIQACWATLLFFDTSSPLVLPGVHLCFSQPTVQSLLELAARRGRFTNLPLLATLVSFPQYGATSCKEDKTT